LLSKNRLSDNNSNARAITSLRDNIILPRTREARKPKNGKGENKNAKNLKYIIINDKTNKPKTTIFVKIETLFPSLFIFDSE